MDIETKLEADYKTAMRAQDKPRVQVIRQVRSKLQEAANAPDFRGPMTEASRQKAISSYVKQLEKSCGELSAGGERGAKLVAQYRVEIDYLTPFLPQGLDDAALREAVQKELAAANVTDARQAGKVLGALMKAHPGRVDAKRARAFIDEALSARTTEG